MTATPEGRSRCHQALHLPVASLATAGFCLLQVVLASPAEAVLVVFNLAQDMPGKPTTITETTAGLSLTASNPSSGYFRSSVPNGFCLYGVGQCHNTTNGNSLTSFDITFSQSVQLISYTVSGANFTGSAPTLSFSSAGQSSVESAPFSQGTRAFATSFIVPVGSTLSYSASGGSGNGFIRLSALTVDTVPDPVPAPLPILGAAGALAMGRRLRGLSRQLH